jgi:hypothetical protein
MIMNLGKLLFAGKSVVNGSKAVEYRQNKQVCLPKFDSRKNPFTPKAPPENVSAAATSRSAPARDKAGPMPATPSAPKFLTSWKIRLNPASAWSGPWGEVQNGLRPAVQSELSLDSVKVIHNDLSDADVEVVPIKSRPAAVIPGLPAAKNSWEALGERLLRATAL